jgi:transposase
VAKRTSSLEERLEEMEARLRATERRLEASEMRTRHLEANRANLNREIKRLREHNAILQEKVRELTARLNQDSSNSSKPPSSDVPWRERRKQKPTGRKSGGQPGREGKTRKPLPPEEVDRTIPVMPERCVGCRSTLRPEDVAGDPLRHQVIEIPPVVAEVVEYVLHALKCRRCGEVTLAELPEGVPNQCAGPRLQAILALLTARFRVTRREARDLVVALFGERAEVSEGTVTNLEQRTSEAIKPAYDEALDAIQSAGFVNCDETGWREGSEKAWLWSAVTPMLKVFRIDPRRNRKAFRKLLFAFKGFLITDRFSVYRIHSIRKRQLCWAHLLRNFRGLEERGGRAQGLGVAGQRIVKAVFREWYRFREGEITRRGLQRVLKPIRRRLERLLRRHVGNPVPAARKIAKDLLEYGEALWTFARVEGVEPTNNAAERAVRKGVLWRKGSFGSHSADGSRFAERMLTVSESLRAQGRSILAFLETAIRAQLVCDRAPSLLVAAA